MACLATGMRYHGPPFFCCQPPCLESSLVHIKHKLRATGEREVKSLVVGELVMAELQKLDEVAYIRFASVYKRFQDLNEFREEIDRLAREPVKE
jgi:transcriptional repressor NrdR